jgi:hypothetical protein
MYQPSIQVTCLLLQQSARMVTILHNTPLVHLNLYVFDVELFPKSCEKNMGCKLICCEKLLKPNRKDKRVIQHSNVFMFLLKTLVEKIKKQTYSCIDTASLKHIMRNYSYRKKRTIWCIIQDLLREILPLNLVDL